ncbi:MAG TPA: bifunctional diaminohydroxyphosphoribosylaminopyrimidine deaminase/5-amino-6-(5-phosphoribosylamino)uracil reductase RibD [Gemmatimonadaceae bacterium]|nr:bifunctional diaminohydroxyphosphoribosylaminopyrimidine deaminase/5-amino-6-(5-phosphoribosylamino)uracil reductase RibD [Gemmatimonadaceae bacterium]
MTALDAAAIDAAHMRRALALARKGWGTTAPNPMVGAVVVRPGDAKVVGEGHHARFGGPHAERVALEAAGDRARGATLYVTLEPCTHHGKQPPCVDAVISAGVKRVVVAAPDPNPVAAGGLERLRGAGIDVEVGVEESAARELNAVFYHSLASDRPFVTLKLAVSIDGAISDAARSSGWLTGRAARDEVHRLRAGHDAIAVGIGTALADDPQLTVRGRIVPRVPPVRVVFDHDARLPLESNLARGAREVSTLVVVGDRAPPDRVERLAAAGVEIVRAADTISALRALRRRELRSLFVEGGAGLAGAMIADGVVDRMIIFQAPIILGAGALGAFDGAPGFSLASAPRLRVVHHELLGDDHMTVYAFDR